MTEKERIEGEASGGNVFADVNLPDADELLFKAQLVVAIQAAIEADNWTQSEAATRIGIGQPDLSKLLRGRLEGFSTDRLLTALNRLGRDVEIRVSSTERASASAHTSVVNV